MPRKKTSSTVPVDLKPLFALIHANIAQLEHAEQTKEVKDALAGLEKARKALRCPGMFLRVSFSPQHD